MVTPLAFLAAMPVGASTTTLRRNRLQRAVISRSTVVLPVPALPVMKSELPFITKSKAFFPYLSNSIRMKFLFKTNLKLDLAVFSLLATVDVAVPRYSWCCNINSFLIFYSIT